MATKVSGNELSGTYPVRRNNNGTVISENAKIQSGWAAFQYSSAGVMAGGTITFPDTYTSPPIVIATMGGDHGNTTIALGNGGNNVHGTAAAKAVGVTTSGFTGYVFQTAGTNFPSGSIVYIHWIAIGV